MPAGYKAIGNLPDPGVLSAPEVRGRFVGRLNKWAKQIQSDFEATTNTWEDHHPVFSIKFSFAGGTVRILVTTKDEVWGYLNRGTNVRWALMSSDFLPKTRPRSLQSFAGRGHAVIRGQRAMTAAGLGPQPGIEAREWNKTVMDLYRDEISADIRAAVREGLSAFFSKGKSLL
jgi:hypothetical protein